MSLNLSIFISYHTLMQTDSWGPHEWESMQNKAFGSPEIFDKDTKRRYALYFETNVQIIPCSTCQSAFSNMMNYIPIDSYLDGRNGLCFWIFMMHNLVNRKLDKPLAIFSQVIFKYENFRARCGSKNDVEKYNACKKELLPYTMEMAETSAREIKARYESISYVHLENYYRSNTVIDPKYHKCEL